MNNSKLKNLKLMLCMLFTIFAIYFGNELGIGTIVSIIACVIVMCIYSYMIGEIKQEQLSEKIIEKTKGTPADLKDATEKLGGTLFVLTSFILDRDHVNPSTVPDIQKGRGLLCHENYPNNPTFFTIFCRWGECVVADSKTRYRVREVGPNGLHVLERFID